MAALSMMTSEKFMFTNAKEIISRAISLTTFNFSRKTSIETDALKVGVAYMLRQTDDK